MAAINSTQVKVSRSVVSTDPTATAGQTTGRGDGLNFTKLDVPKATIRYELIKENMGDTPDTANAFEKVNVGVIHSQSN